MAAATHRAVSAHPWVIVGCGYTGGRLAARLLGAGATVIATRRTAEGAAALRAALPGVTSAAVELSDTGALAALVPAGAVVVVSAPPADERGAAEAALAVAAAGRGAARLVYLSSTGVYPAAGGGWVDERTSVAPLGRHGQLRLAAEQALLRAAAGARIPAVSLRVAAIYGPGRGVHARLLAGTYRVIGAGASFVSRVHVDDLVAAIVAAGTVEPLPGEVYTVADDEPTTARAYADAVAAALNLPPPPSAPPESVSPAAVAMLGADRRVRNTRLARELGVKLAYPTWREGLAQACAEDGISLRDPDAG